MLQRCSLNPVTCTSYTACQQLDVWPKLLMQSERLLLKTLVYRTVSILPRSRPGCVTNLPICFRQFPALCISLFYKAVQKMAGSFQVGGNHALARWDRGNKGCCAKAAIDLKIALISSTSVICSIIDSVRLQQQIILIPSWKMEGAYAKISSASMK
jgi:hypothetical protein